MADLKDLMDQEVEAARFGPDPLEGTLRRVAVRRRKRRLGAAAISLTLVAGTLAVLFPIGFAGTARKPTTPPPTVAGPVGPPIGAVAAAGSVWWFVQQCGEEEITTGRCTGWAVRQDPVSHHVIARIAVSSPMALAVGDGSVWVADYLPGGVTRIDPRTNRVIATIPLALREPVGNASDRFEFLPLNIAAGDGDVWVSGRNEVAKIDATTDRVVERLVLGARIPGQIAIGAGAVWVSAGLDGIIRIDPTTDRIAGTVAPATQGVDRLMFGNIVVGAGSVWATGRWVDGNDHYVRDWALARIDPAGNRVSATIPLLGPVSGGSPRVWVSGDRVVVAGPDGVGWMQANSNEPPSAFIGYPGPGGPDAVAVDGSGVWFVARDGEVLRLASWN